MPEPKIVKVTWRDCTYTTESLRTKEAEGYKLLDLITVGFLVGDREDAVVLAQERQEKMDEDMLQWRHIIAIPRVNVLKVDYLDIPSPAPSSSS